MNLAVILSIRICTQCEPSVQRYTYTNFNSLAGATHVPLLRVENYLDTETGIEWVVKCNKTFFDFVILGQ